MFFDAVFSNLWLTILLTVVLYATSHLMVRFSWHLYESGAKQLVPLQKAIAAFGTLKQGPDGRAILKPSVWVGWIPFVLYLVLAWYACHDWMMWLRGAPLPELFEAVAGGMVLLQLFMVFQNNLRSVFMMHYARQAKGLRGRLEHSQWFNFREISTSAVNCGVLYLLIFLIFSEAWAFLSGSLLCLVLALKYRAMSDKEDLDTWTLEDTVS